MLMSSAPDQGETLAAALRKHQDMNILPLAPSREAAVGQAPPDLNICLLDPDVLKDRTLSRFLRTLQAKAPNVRVVLVMKNAVADEQLIADIKAGIRGYVRVSDPPALIAKAIRAVHEGEIWAERRILEKAIAKPMILPETLHTQFPGMPPLTTREMEMLTMLLQGSTNKEIAARTSISERTVKTHLYRIYKKLKVKSRTKAIALLSQA